MPHVAGGAGLAAPSPSLNARLRAGLQAPPHADGYLQPIAWPAQLTGKKSALLLAPGRNHKDTYQQNVKKQVGQLDTNLVSWRIAHPVSHSRMSMCSNKAPFFGPVN